MEISGAVTVVTGASRGIGKVIAGELVRRGAKVAVTARSEGDLKTVADSERGLVLVTGVSGSGKSSTVASPG